MLCRLCDLRHHGLSGSVGGKSTVVGLLRSNANDSDMNPVRYEHFEFMVENAYTQHLETETYDSFWISNWNLLQF